MSSFQWNKESLMLTLREGDILDQLRMRFLILSTVNILGQIILCCER
jgi:hypothetical protein